ncbi:hypothetical protein QM565_36550 [Geitlerinema splendidum]|nr:hypothetical protein [Geitlerinema splendidum]
MFFFDGKLSRYVDERETLGFRIRHIELDLSFDLPKKMAKMTTDIRMERGDDAGAHFFVRLGPNYKVSSVELGGEAYPYSQAGGVIALPAFSSREATLTLTYSGVVDRPRFSGAITEDEVMMTNDLWCPAIARLPATLNTRTHVPPGWIVVGQGVQANLSKGDSAWVYDWELDMPVSYYSLSAGPFKHVSRVIEGMTYNVWTRHLKEDEMEDQCEFFAPVLQFFNTLAPTPFRSYGAVVTPLYGGGALEAYSYATYGTGWLPDEDAHEPSHTWWGGMIPNTYLNSFWNESFAVFSEGLYAREGRIGRIADKRIAFVSGANANGSYRTLPVESAGAETGGIASALGYGKGGLVLQQLEFEMGTDRMMDCLRRFLREHKRGEAADWKDFEAVCGPEWKWFFDQWIRKTGWPEVSLSEVTSGKGKVQVLLQQKGDAYRFKTEVYVETTEGSYVSTVEIRPDDSGLARIEVDAPGELVLVSLDPYDRVLMSGRPALPERWSANTRRAKEYVVASRASWAPEADSLASAPPSLVRCVLVGLPGDDPRLDSLFKQAGIGYVDGMLTYRGMRIDPEKGAIVSMVEFEPGKWCGVRAGWSKYSPKVGIAQTAVVDHLGRFLSGTVMPRKAGPLVWRRS